MTIDELLEKISQAKDDIKALEKLEECFQLVKEPKPGSKLPAVEFNPKKITHSIESEEGFGGDAAINLANFLSRTRRRAQYNLMIRSGYSGPIIVAEGDSWFEYPVRLDDVLDHLMNRYAVYSLAGAGHLIEEMYTDNEYLDYVRSEQPQFFLLSGGGNDMLHDNGLSRFLNPFVAGMTIDQIFNSSALEEFLNTILSTYQDMLSRINSDFPNVYMLFHGYDYCYPVQNGHWLGTPLAAAGVPKQFWNEIARRLIDQFNTRLKALESLFPGKAFHIDCRASVGSENEWYDELHPKDEGFGRAASCFIERIEAIIIAETHQEGLVQFLSQRVRSMMTSTDIGSPEISAEIRRQNSLNSPSIGTFNKPAGNFASTSFNEQIIVTPPRELINVKPQSVVREELEAWQAKLTPEDKIAYDEYIDICKQPYTSDEEEQQEIEARKEMLSEVDPFALERIINQSNLYQSSYLAHGMKAAKAVGRISVVNRYGMQRGCGTGFLVAPGLLLTNNHVLGSIEDVRKSHILFDYEYDEHDQLKTPERFQLTDEIFFTSPELDFTFVSVAPTSQHGTSLADFGKLMLLPQSGKAIVKESVTIIQHPDGKTKQLALRDSEIRGRRRDFIYYTTDTNPGSSGAPVLTDQWIPVALHHRTVPNWYRPNEFVANRGIRISSIWNRIESASQTDQNAKHILMLLAAEIDLNVIHNPQSQNSQFTGSATTEALREPYRISLDSPVRNGYQSKFLGVDVPLPKLVNLQSSVAAPLLSGNSYLLNYDHFSVVMHKTRRLPLFTASNVDANPKRKKPDFTKPATAYTREGLSGLSKNDREKWFTDPRISLDHQLSDMFFNKDDQSFDKGHIVRREDVAWGLTYDELRRANGDTYYVTNCTPQVKEFNRAPGIWGKFENELLNQAKIEKLCVFAGPILANDDERFQGRLESGKILVQIPRKYWKVIVALKANKLQSFAFVFEQDLTNVNLEFTVASAWQPYQVSINQLETFVKYFTFPDQVRNSDQF